MIITEKYLYTVKDEIKNDHLKFRTIVEGLNDVLLIKIIFIKTMVWNTFVSTKQTLIKKI